MTNRDVQWRLGLGAIASALFLVFVAIPFWVSSPSNVGDIILSPVFWPYTLAGFMALTGVGLLITAQRDKRPDDPLEPEPLVADPAQARLRLIGMAVLMGLTMLALPRLGMVWTTMLAFAACAFLIKTRHPKTALVCAVTIPLLLYAFFAHVAGVAIPQGDFVRLP